MCKQRGSYAGSGAGRKRAEQSVKQMAPWRCSGVCTQPERFVSMAGERWLGRRQSIASATNGFISVRKGIYGKGAGKGKGKEKGKGKRKRIVRKRDRDSMDDQKNREKKKKRKQNRTNKKPPICSHIHTYTYLHS
jgi:hypothetical protein